MIGLDETKFVSNNALWRMGGPDNIDDLCWFSAWKGARFVNGLKKTWNGCFTSYG